MSYIKLDSGSEFEGRPIEYYKMSCGPVDVMLCTFGGGLRGIYLPVGDEKRNIIVRFAHEEEYFGHKTWTGAVIAPNAGRIAELGKDPVLHIDGTDYVLSKNERGLNNLHGGFKNTMNSLWDLYKAEDRGEDGARIVFKIELPDGLEGWPGNRTFYADWSLDKDGLHVELSATTDKKTYVNPTVHPFFNLSGDYTISAHKDLYTLKASRYIPNKLPETVPQPAQPVEGTAFDLRHGRSITSLEDMGDPEINAARHAFNNAFLLDEVDGPQLHIESADSGLAVDITTDGDTMVICSARFFEGVELENGVIGIPEAGVASEFQDIVNEPNARPDTCHWLVPGEVYRRKIDFKFTY